MALATDFLKVVDVLFGRPCCAVLGAVLARRGPAAASSGAPRRVLVIRPGGIGDAVLFVPMLRELRRAWPDARIELLAERRNAGLVDGAGLVDEVLRYDRFPGDLWRALRGRYDLVIDTEQYHCLSALVAAATGAPRRIGFGTNVRRRLFTDSVPYSQAVYEAVSFLSLARAATGREPAWDPDQPFYPLSQPALDFADETLRGLSGLVLAAVHPGASIPERRWPVERYAELARRLSDDGLGIVILGGGGDRAAAATIERALTGRRFVNLAGRTTLPRAAAIVARVAVYVSADTGLLHLAYAVGTPTVHLFGPGVLAKWGPPGRKFSTVAAHAPCSPCTIYGYTPPCCQGMICMLGIAADVVHEAVRARLRDAGVWPAAPAGPARAAGGGAR